MVSSNSLQKSKVKYPAISNNRMSVHWFKSKKRRKTIYFALCLYLKKWCFKEIIYLLLIFRGLTREFSLKCAINANWWKSLGWSKSTSECVSLETGQVFLSLEPEWLHHNLGCDHQYFRTRQIYLSKVDSYW